MARAGVSELDLLTFFSGARAFLGLTPLIGGLALATALLIELCLLSRLVRLLLRRERLPLCLAQTHRKGLAACEEREKQRKQQEAFHARSIGKTRPEGKSV